jgi:hypothetical protein
MNGRTKARTWNIVQGKASVNAKVGYRGLLGTVAEIMGEYEAKGNHVTRRNIGHIFAGVTRADAASQRPYEEKATANVHCPHEVPSAKAHS